MNLSEFSIKHHVAVVVLVIAIIVSGVYCYVTLPRESFPEITIPNVIVSTPYEGVAPSDIENLVTRHIEKKLGGVSDVKEIRSYSSEGMSTIVVEFDSGIDIDTALQKVRDKVDEAKSDLPDDLEEDPSVEEINFSEFPIMTVVIAGPVGLVRLKDIADEMVDDFEAIPGVLEATITGGLEREIIVTFEPERLASYGIALSDILQSVTTNNSNTPGGDLDIGEGNYLVKIPGEFQTPAEAKRLIVYSNEKKPVYITDVAEVRDGYEEPKTMARLNRSEAISINVIKRSGVNLIGIADSVKATLKGYEGKLPEGTRVSIVMDQSKDIRVMVADLENSILSGLVLVLVVVFAAMGLRNALIVASAIPLSMMLSFLAIKMIGLTLNMMVLFSMVLAVGMLVDNAIVIVENIYRHRQEGKSRMNAAVDATNEVMVPVITSTLTTVAAFFPMVFWPGIVGEFMSYLPMTVIIVLFASLFVALVVNPTLGALFIKAKGKPGQQRQNFFTKGYRWLLTGAVDYPFFVVGLAVCTLILVFTAYGRFGHGTEFFPDVEPQRAFVDIKMPEGTNLDQTDALMRQVETYAAEYEDVRSQIANVGSTGGTGEQMFTGAQSSPDIGRLMLEFQDIEERGIASSRIIEELRGKTSGIYQAEVEITKEENGPPTGAPITVEISGEKYEVLEGLMRQVKEQIRGIPGLVNLKDDYVVARPEIVVDVDKERAAILGLSTEAVARVVKAAVRGLEAGVYREGNDEYDIIVQLPLERRRDLEAVRNLRVINKTGEYVPISSVADIRLSAGLGTIVRSDQNRVITVEADAEGRLGNDVLLDVQKTLAPLELPQGYKIRYRGESEEQDEAIVFLSEAFIGALLLIALVLVTEFNSVYRPFIILSSVILSTMGVFLGLLLLSKPFGIIMTGIGVISLAGVVVNNAIVLLDYVDQLRQRGMDKRESLIEAGTVRLRPVLLTAITTVLGLLPMGMGVNFDFMTGQWQQGTESMQWWGPMAVAVIFGLSVATVLTLVVVPSMVSIGDKTAWLFGKLFSFLRDDHTETSQQRA